MRLSLPALILMGLIPICGACGSGDNGDDGNRTTPPTPIVDPGPNESDLNDYRQLVDFVVKDVDDYWRRTFATVYENKPPYSGPEIKGEYTSEDDAPDCGGHEAPLKNAFYCPAGDYLAWDGPGLLFPFYQAGDMGAALVIAHEWGHAIQQRAGQILDVVTILSELQADCFAGAWAADADGRGLLEPGDIEEAISALYRVRDPADTPWLDLAAHGNAGQRINAFQDGFDSGPLKCKAKIPF